MVFCFFTAQYLPTPGGVERYTHNLGKELARRGHRVKVVTSALPGEPSHEIEESGIEVFRVDSFLFLGGRFPAAKPTPSLWRTLDKALSDTDEGIIQTRFYPLSYFAAQRCKKRGVPFLVVDHGAAHLEMGNALLNVLGQAYEHFITALLKRKTADFFAVSEAGAAWLSHFGIAAKGVLYNAIDPSLIAGALQMQADTEKMCAPFSGRPSVVFSGRLVPEKGILQLTEAIEALQQKFAPVLFVAGDGPLQGKLPQKEWLVELGRLSQPDVFCLLKRCDIFCLPSESEGMSTAVLEAAACGCYVITTDRGGSKELISSPAYGTVLPGSAAEPLARALAAALEGGQARKKAAENAREKVLAQFTFKATADTLCAFTETRKKGTETLS